MILKGSQWFLAVAVEEGKLWEAQPQLVVGQTSKECPTIHHHHFPKHHHQHYFTQETLIYKKWYTLCTNAIKVTGLL